MIGKLARNNKAQWEQHLLELLQAYNSTWSAITSYSPHYLMFGRHPCLPIDYYLQTNSEAKKQKWYYDQAMSMAQLVLGYVVLVGNNKYQGKWKVKDW